MAETRYAAWRARQPIWLAALGEMGIMVLVLAAIAAPFGIGYLLWGFEGAVFMGFGCMTLGIGYKGLGWRERRE